MAPRILTSDEAVRLLPHKRFDRAQLVLFEGQRGYGKTYALMLYLEEREPRVFVLDPFGDFTGIAQSPSVEAAIADLEANRVAGRRRVVPPITDASVEYAEAFFRMAIERLRNCTIVLDEVTLWTGIQSGRALLTLINQGRRLGIRIVVACQRISLVPGDLLSAVTEMVIFHPPRRPRDRYVLKEWTDEETVEAARTLGVGRCIVVLDM